MARPATSGAGSLHSIATVARITAPTAAMNAARKQAWRSHATRGGSRVTGTARRSPASLTIVAPGRTACHGSICGPPDRKCNPTFVRAGVGRVAVRGVGGAAAGPESGGEEAAVTVARCSRSARHEASRGSTDRDRPAERAGAGATLDAHDAEPGHRRVAGEGADDRAVPRPGLHRARVATGTSATSPRTPARASSAWTSSTISRPSTSSTRTAASRSTRSARRPRRADSVYLATDLDREGEAIAWHVVEAADIPDGQDAPGDVQRDHARRDHARRSAIRATST